MPRKHWMFDMYLALIAQGHSGEEARHFVSKTFPTMSGAEVDAILSNMGDIKKAEDDYANSIIRAKVAELKDGTGPRDELATRMFGKVETNG